MKSAQIIVAAAILIVGGAALAIEYGLVKWWPVHKENQTERLLSLHPYRNDGLGIEMQVASGIYGKVASFPGGVKIYRPRLIGAGPSITITSQPNPDHGFEFSPQTLAIWETEGVQKGIRDYRFEHAQIMKRDAALIWQYKNRRMLLTLREITPDRIIEANCNAGDESNESLYMQACESSLRTLRMAGPEPPEPAEPGIQEIPGPPIH